MSEPGTSAPRAAEPSASAPSAPEPGAPAPRAAEPGAPAPRAAEPSAGKPSAPEPSAPEPGAPAPRAPLPPSASAPSAPEPGAPEPGAPLPPSASAARRLAIVGYGKMGRLVEQLAPEYGFAVALKLDEFNNANFEGITAENFRGIDVAIDFSIPAAVRRNVEAVAALGVNLVVGTTGWLEHAGAVKQAVEQHGIGLVWSPNYSIGVNAFFRLVREAARLLESQPAYGAWAWEIHHSTKKDAPSGTLLKLVDEMKKAGYARPIDIGSNRAGAHPGTHEIGFDSSADTITLRHTARSREGFARGALQAAQWIIGNKGFHEFGEILFQREEAVSSLAES